MGLSNPSQSCSGSRVLGSSSDSTHLPFRWRRALELFCFLQGTGRAFEVLVIRPTTVRQSRLLGFPAGQPYLPTHRTGRYCLGLHPLPGFRIALWPPFGLAVARRGRAQMLTRTAIDPGLMRFTSPQRYPLMSFGPGRACSWSVFQDRCLVRPGSPSTRRGILRSGGRRLQKGDAPGPLPA